MVYEDEDNIRNCVGFYESSEERKQKIDALSQEVLMMARNTLLVNLRFLDMALHQFRLQPFDGTYATDGKIFMYEPLFVLNSYKMETGSVTHAYLHVVLHCVYHHMFIHKEVDQKIWDLACDIAAEHTIFELGIKGTEVKRQKQQEAIFGKLQEEIGSLTAEKIYRYYKTKEMIPEALESLIMLFYVDSHFAWYPANEEQVEKKHRKNDDKQDKTLHKDLSTEPDPDTKHEDIQDKSDAAEELWRNISRRMQTDLETFHRKQGHRAGSLLQNLQAVNREKCDYTDFLRKFAANGEIMKVNNDEFDYIFYTYGLKLYKNMPLVEPLEYKEVKRIKEFVIVIDTSFSVSGKTVQAFMQKTYNVLKTTESFFSKINLHIIQCDADIQNDTKITSQKEFDKYISEISIHGLGGTDFRPAFQYVDELIRNKEFTDLRGLIYFTDGYGTFPSQKPAYESAFVFLRKDERRPKVPPWAIRVMLDEEELTEGM